MRKIVRLFGLIILALFLVSCSGNYADNAGSSTVTEKKVKEDNILKEAVGTYIGNQGCAITLHADGTAEFYSQEWGKGIATNNSWKVKGDRVVISLPDLFCDVYFETANGFDQVEIKGNPLFWENEKYTKFTSSNEKFSADKYDIMLSKVEQNTKGKKESYRTIDLDGFEFSIPGSYTVSEDGKYTLYGDNNFAFGMIDSESLEPEQFEDQREELEESIIELCKGAGVENVLEEEIPDISGVTGKSFYGEALQQEKKTVFGCTYLYAPGIEKELLLFFSTDSSKADEADAAYDRILSSVHVKGETADKAVKKKPEKSSSSGSSYQEILEEYSKKLRDATPRLIEEYQEEARNNTRGIEGLAELSNEKIGVLAEINNEGIGEMANIMLFSESGSYAEYEKWAGKLTEVYMEEAGKITDVYMKSAM